MPKFFVLSDLHIDNYANNTGDAVTHDVFVHIVSNIPNSKDMYWILAGDVSSFGEEYTEMAYKVLGEMASKFKGVYMVFGNHDYATYRDTIGSLNICREYAKKYVPNMTILDGDVVECEGVRIGGCMGWYTWLDNLGIDDNIIPWKSWYDGKCWDYLGNDLHRISECETSKMRKVLNQYPDIMITHVAHEVMNTNPKFKTDYTNKYMFYLDRDFDFTGVKYLINGHIHHSDMRDVGDMKVLANPFGYWYQSPLEVHGYDMHDFIFEV